MRHVAGFSADVYSTGITLCELATCTAPYADRGRNVALAHTVLDLSYNERDLAIAIAAEHLRPALPGMDGGCPPGLCDVITACWAGDAGSRPSAAALHAQLAQLCTAHAAQLPDRQLRPVWHPPPPPPEEIDAILCGGGDPAAPPQWSVPALDEDDTPDCTPCVAAAALATPGLRGADKMEDRHVIASPLFTGTAAESAATTAHLFAVFDGHRGAEAAQFAADALPRALAAAASAPGCQAQESLAQAFVAVDAAFKAVDDTRAAASVAGGAARRYPGATAIAALVWGRHLYVANAGDCRAMLVRGTQAVALTRDHTAEDAGERARVEAAGGSLQRDASGKWRVGAAGLAVTRGLGDFDARDCGLTPEPEITRVTLEPEDEYIVLACDGLWDVLTVDDVAQLVASTVKEPGMVAKRLVAEAMTRGSGDNVTVLVAFLKRQSTAEAVWWADGDAAATSLAAP